MVAWIMYDHEHALEFLALQATKGREAGLACPLVLQSETKKPNLNQDCINFLLLIGRTANSIQGFPDSLYQVRNALVHRLRLLLGNTVALNELKKVNEGFELLLLDMLSSYHPSTTLTLDTEYTFFKDILIEKSR